MKFKSKELTIGVGLSLSLLLAGCGGSEEVKQDTSNEGSGEETTSISKEVDYTIIGIEPGAGIMEKARNTLEEYENLEGWELSESSTAGMITLLDEAISKEEPIIVTGWNPHWKFASYDLKYIEDPKGTFGGAENINTVARLGLEEDMPVAYTLLDRFQWEAADMEAVMLDAKDAPFEEAAKNWIDANQSKIDEWTNDLEKVDGQAIELVITPWDSERASGEVMKQILEQQGFNVTVTPVDPAIVFQAIANGEADASLAPWLPITHGSFYEEYKEDMIDLGPNIDGGAKLGLVVPEYVDIDSIEDLEPKE